MILNFSPVVQQILLPESVQNDVLFASFVAMATDISTVLDLVYSNIVIPGCNKPKLLI